MYARAVCSYLHVPVHVLAHSLLGVFILFWLCWLNWSPQFPEISFCVSVSIGSVSESAGTRCVRCLLSGTQNSKGRKCSLLAFLKRKGKYVYLVTLLCVCVCVCVCVSLKGLCVRSFLFFLQLGRFCELYLTSIWTCYVWSLTLCCAATGTLLKVDQKQLEGSEIWCWCRMEKMSWIDRVKNEEVLRTVTE